MKLAQCLPFIALGSALVLSTTARADVPPDEPPTISITSPMDGATFDGPTASVDVTLETDPGNLGITQVVLRVDGEDVVTDMAEPWGFEAVEIGEGMHTLVAVAVDEAYGDNHFSQEVSIVVFGAEGTDSTGDTSEDGEGDGGGGGGCDAVSHGRLGTGSAMILLGLFTLGLARRRREGAQS